MEFKIKRVFGGRLILNNYCIKMLFLFYIKLAYLKRLRKNRTFFLYNQSKYYYKIKYLLYKEEK